MKVKYKVFKRGNDKGNYAEMPLLNVRLKHRKEVIQLNCLVDSGAGDCVFNEQIAEALGIDLTKSKTKVYEAVGGAQLEAKIHPIKIQVVGFDDEWISVSAGFIEHDDQPLLGHNGFFENFEITFRTFRNQFEIKRKKT